MEEARFSVFENRVRRKIFGTNAEQGAGDWKHSIRRSFTT
jgi:hypothetical protein